MVREETKTKFINGEIVMHSPLERPFSLVVPSFTLEISRIFN